MPIAKAARLLLATVAWVLTMGVPTLRATSSEGQVAPPAPAGAVTVETQSDVCDGTTVLRLTKVDVAASGAISRITREAITSDDCRWALDGLVPGTYQIDLMRTSGSAGSSQPFIVSAQRTTQVVVAPANVGISGRVSVNGQPLRGAWLEFSPVDRLSGPVPAITEADGRYSTTLARPGRYEWLLRGRSAPTSFRTIDVSAGVNAVDWTIPAGGSLSVRVSGIRPGLATTVHIQSRRAGHDTDLVPGEAPTVTKHGLEFGLFSVSAQQGDARVSPIENIELDAGHPTAVVELALVENRSALVVAGPNGATVESVRVRRLVPAHALMRVGGTLKPTGAGLFALDGISPGTFLMIKADGLVPQCRVVPFNDTIYAELEAGRRVNVRLPRGITPAVIRDLAALADIPGSDCPVPMAEFTAQLLGPADPKQRLRVVFPNFPSSARFGLLRLGSRLWDILVPDQGDVVVE